MAGKIEPIGQRVVAKPYSVADFLARIFSLGGPDQHKDCPRPHKQRMSAVIDVLAAKVPDLQPRAFLTV